MRFLVVIVCLIIQFGTFTLELAHSQQKESSIDLILILDLSASMEGAGGSEKIFRRVQNSCIGIVDELKNGDTFTLITFGDDVTVYPTATILDKGDRQKIFNLINNLKADKKWTYMSAALKSGLEEAQRLEKLLPGNEKLIFILTDGLNDPPPQVRDKGPTLRDVAKPYEKKGWYVYQVQYGSKADRDLDEAARMVGPGGTIMDKGAQSGIDKLRKPLKEPRKKSFTLSLEPRQLEITLDRISTPAETVCRFKLPDDLNATDFAVTLTRKEIPDSIGITNELLSEPDGTVKVRVRAVASEKIKNATWRGQLRLALSETKKEYTFTPVEVPLSVVTKLIPPVWPYWLGGIAVALVLGAIVLLFLKRQRESRLFGSLQYHPVGTPQMIQKVDDLSRFGRKVTIGSGDIPTGNDVGMGTLTTRKVEGDYLVVVAPAEGNKLVFEGKTAVEVLLYNGDKFILGPYEFKYTGATGRRPRK